MKNFKRILALVLTLMFIVGSCASLSAYSGTSKWYGKAVNWIESTGIDTIGSSADKEIDRNTFAMWIAKIESTFVDDNLWDDKADSTSFADVKPGDHYYAAIAYAEESGFIQGDGDGNFRPNDTISFAEACAIITRVMGYDEFFEAYYGADRTKYATYEEWYKATWQYNYIRVAELRCKAIDATWVANVGRFVPQHKLTKGQAAYLLYTLATNGANVRHNGYDMGYKLGATLPSIKVTAVVKTLARKPLNDKQLQGYISGGYGEAVNGQVTKSLTWSAWSKYWTERNYDVYGQVVTPYSKILDTTKAVELQIFDGENFTGTTIELTGTKFQQLVRKALGKPANVDVANEEVFYLFDYVREGSVLNLTVSGNTVKSLSIVDNHVVDTYRVLVGTTVLDYYLNGLANSYGTANNNAALPTAYNAEKDVTSWNGNKLVFQGTTYTLRAKGSNYTGISDEIKVYGYEKVGVSKYDKTADRELVAGKTYYTFDSTSNVYTKVATPKADELSAYYAEFDKYYTVGTGEVVWVERGTAPAANLGKWLERGNLVQLTAAEAKAQLINAAQGEVEAVFSDMDGDGKYDVAVVTNYDAFFIADNCENIVGGGAEGKPDGDPNHYAKGVPSAGAVIINQTVGSDGVFNTDAWTLDASKPTNKVQFIFNVSDRHGASGILLNQWYQGFRATPNLGTGAIDVLSYASGYIQDVIAKADNGYYKVSIPVAKTDAETGATTIEYTVAYLPSFGYVPTTQTVSYTLAGATAEITVGSKTWMSFVTDFYKNNFGYAYKTADGKQFVYTDATGTNEYTDARLFNAGQAFVYNGKVVTAAEKAAILAKITYVKTKDVNDLYYSKTTDTELVAGKTYYTWDADAAAYTAVQAPDVANIGTYFEYNVKTYYVFADAETNTYYEVTNPVKEDLGKYYVIAQEADTAFTAITLKTLTGVEGFTTDTKVITDQGYGYAILVLQPNDEGIYKVADDASVMAMVSAWVNNKYINYVLDAEGKVILAKSAAADNGRGFVVNVEKSAENNTYKVDLAVTGTYKSVNNVYYSTATTVEEIAAMISGSATNDELKAKFNADPKNANIWRLYGCALGDIAQIEPGVKDALKGKTLAEAAAKIISSSNVQKYEGAVSLKTYNVRASASTIWDIANAATYRAIYGGSLAHDLVVGEYVTAKNFYYVTMTKETGSYSVMRLSTGNTAQSSTAGAKTQTIFYWSDLKDENGNWVSRGTSHWLSTSWRNKNYYWEVSVSAGEASDLAWPNAGIVIKLDSTKSDPFYVAKVSESSLFVEGKTYYAYDATKGTYSVVANPVADDLATYYERVLNKTVGLTGAELTAAKNIAKSAMDAFVAKYSYVVVSVDKNGYNPEYRVKSYSNGKYTFEVVFTRAAEVTTTTTYKPYPVKANDGKYTMVYDENGAIVKGDALVAEKMTQTSGTKTIEGTTKNWVYYSFNGVIYAELEPATSFSYIKADGTVNYVGIETVGASVELDNNKLSDYPNVDTSSMSMFKSIRTMDKNESGFIPGYYMVTLASDPTTELKVAGSTTVTVMVPDNAAGTLTSTTTTFKNLVASGSALFATRVQIAVSADLKTITNITVIGEFKGAQQPVTPSKTGTIVYVGSDATTVLNADETGTSYIVKTDRPAYALDGSEFGPVYYEYDTTDKNFKPEDLKFIVTPGSFYKVDKNGKILANLGSMFGTRTVSKSNVLVGTTTYNYTYDLAKFENKLDKSFFGTATITGVTGGKILATVDGEKNVDITGWNVKFIYTDLDATKLFLAEDNTNVGVAAFNEIVSGTESKYNEAALAKKVYEAARDGGVLSAATVAKYKEAYDAAVVALEEAKEAALAKMNGQFWSASTVEASAIKRYLDSAKYTYGVANPTLTFTYLNVNDTYYVIVPSFSK